MTITEFFRRLIGKPLNDTTDDDADCLRAIEADGWVTFYPAFTPFHDRSNSDE